MRLAWLLPVAACFACGTTVENPPTLACDWLAGSDNCWQNAALMAKACLPPESETGVLSGDNMTCTYASGATVTFTPAVVIPTPILALWNFTIADASGAPCLHYEDGPRKDLQPSSRTLVVDGDAAVTATQNGLAGAIACPDGTGLQIANVAALDDCQNIASSNWPALAGASSLVATDPPFITAELAGVLGGLLPLFKCRGSSP